MSTTIALLERVKDLLVALPLRDHPQHSLAFERVELYRKKNLATAMNDLRIFKESRVALVIPTGDDFSEKILNEHLASFQRQIMFTVLVADRDYGRRQSAMEGDDNTVGVLTLKDAILDPENDILWNDLGVDGCRITPEGADPFTLSDDQEEDLPGRECWAVHLRVVSTRKQSR